MKITLPSFVYSLALILLFTGLKSERVYSQSIDETEWIACNIYEDTTYLRFANGNIYFKSPEVEGFEDFVAVSMYSTSGDTLFWNDLADPEQCDPMITGKYLYQISSDTLTFSALEDDCDFRLKVLSELILKRIQTTSVADLFHEKIIIYPNPVTNNLLTIDINDNVKYHYWLFDVTGVLVKKGTSVNVEILDLASLQQGSYFLLLSDDKGQSLGSFKIIKI